MTEHNSSHPPRPPRARRGEQRPASQVGRGGQGQRDPGRPGSHLSARPKPDGRHEDSNSPRRARPLGPDTTKQAHPPAARNGERSRAGGMGRGPRGPRGKASEKKMLPPMKHVIQGKGHEDSLLRFIPLGGLEEIGRNCSFFEYKNEIIIVDVGIQFPEEETPGVDYIIPNVAYLEARKKDIRAIFLTHGHYDHIAAIHYLVEKLGNPTIYTADITKAIVARRHEEFINAPKLNFRTVKDGDKVKISENFTAEFFNVGHTIPDALGFILDTPAGKMVSFGDFRLDIDKNGEPERLDIFKRIGTLGVHTLFVDSTNAQREGFSSSERIVEKNLEELIKNAPGRIVIATFASLLVRIMEIIKSAEHLGRKVAVNGRSMKDNLTIAQELGYFKPKPDTMIPVEEIGKYRDEKIVILTTGAQGEPNAGLMRIVNGEHKVVRLKASDTVVFSSSVIPGNERSVQALQDNISRQVDNLYNSKLLDIHTSGHACAEDIKLVLKLCKPKFVVPIHAYYFMRKSVVGHAASIGMDKSRVIMMDNGQVAHLTKDSIVVSQDRVDTSYVMVDGLGVGDVEEVVLRDRRSLSQEGMVVMIVTVSRQNGRMLRHPDIISRGFIYLKENQTIIEEVRRRIAGIIDRLPNYQEVETDYLKTLLRDQIGQLLYDKTRRRPMIIPVVIEL